MIEHHHINVFAALAAATSEIYATGIKTDQDGQVGNRKFGYTSLQAINEVAVPILARHGLVLSHVQNEVAVETTLTHIMTGQDISSQCPMRIGGADADGNPMQQIGSAQSYAIRYNVRAVLNLATDSNDSDNQGSGNQQGYSRGQQQSYQRRPAGGAPASQKALGYLDRLFGELGASPEKRGRFIKKASNGRTENAAELKSPECAKAIDRLKEAIADNKKAAASTAETESPDLGLDSEPNPEPVPQEAE